MNIIDDLNAILKKHKIDIKLNTKNISQEMKNLGIDSLAAMEIIIDIEEQYKIQLPDDDLMKLKTGEDLIKAIEKQINKK